MEIKNNNPLSAEAFDSCFVCFLDILGFKDIVLNNSDQSIKEIMDELSDCLISVASQNHYPIDPSKSIISHLRVSDSMILWTSDLSLMSFHNMVRIVRSLLCHALFHGTPLRGGISMGSFLSKFSTEQHEYIPGVPVTVTNATYYGKALIDAYAIQESAEWSGCAIDCKCLIHLVKMLKEIPDGTKYKQGRSVLLTHPNGLPFLYDNFFDDHVVIEYAVPMKNGQHQIQTVIDWPNPFIEFAPKSESIESLLTSRFKYHGKQIESSGAYAKLLNSIKFVEDMRPRYEANLKRRQKKGEELMKKIINNEAED